MDFEVMKAYLPRFWDALLLTLRIGWQGVALALALGVACAVAVHWKIPVLRQIVGGYIELFRNTPLLVQLFFLYFALPKIGIRISAETCGKLGLGLLGGAYMAETVRGGILSIDPGQTEGAKAIGMTHVQTMNAVILPQALRNIMPQIGNNLIINIKDTCVLSVIGTVELFFATKSVAGAMYTYFEAFTITMVIYFVLTFSCSRLLRLCESKMDGPDSYELYDLATTDTLAHTTGLYSYPKKPRENTQNNDIRDGGR